MRIPYLRFGLEIEAEYNLAKVKNMPVGEYHRGIKILNYWETQRDASLKKTNPWSSFSSTCEFVSVPLRASGKRGVPAALKELQKFLAANGEELHKVLNFNSSCGAHIHFSVENIKQFKKGLISEQEKLLHRIVLEEMSKQGFTKEQIDLFNKQYYRSYAGENVIGLKDVRTQSINFCKNKTLEWRSFNLIHCETWSDLNKSYLAAIKSIKRFYKEIVKTDFLYEKEVVTEDMETLVISFDREEERQRLEMYMNYPEENDYEEDEDEED